MYLPEAQRRRGYPIEFLAMSPALTGFDVKLAAAGHQHVQMWHLLEGMLML